MLRAGRGRPLGELENQPRRGERPGGRESDDLPGNVSAVGVESALALGGRGAILVDRRAVVVLAEWVGVERGDVVSVGYHRYHADRQPDPRGSGGAPFEHGAKL